MKRILTVLLLSVMFLFASCSAKGTCPYSGQKKSCGEVKSSCCKSSEKPCCAKKKAENKEVKSSCGSN